MSLRTKVGKGLAGLVLVGSSMGLGGCGAVIEAIGRDNAAHVRGKYEVEAARVYAQAQRERELRNEFFACNYIKDFNDDGGLELPKEAVGIGKKFPADGNITFIGHFIGLRGKRITFELYNGRGNLVEEDNRVLTKSNSVLHPTYKKELNPDNYVAVWRNGLDILGKTEITVLPGKRSLLTGNDN